MICAVQRKLQVLKEKAYGSLRLRHNRDILLVAVRADRQYLRSAYRVMSEPLASVALSQR